MVSVSPVLVPWEELRVLRSLVHILPPPPDVNFKLYLLPNSERREHRARRVALVQRVEVDAV